MKAAGLTNAALARELGISSQAISQWRSGGTHPIGARLDMHGFDQDQARPALEGFIRRAYADGHRAVLIITGKGKIGHGVLKKRTPEWLAAPALRDMIAGVSQADQRHGGEGALYVALKRRA